MTGVAGSVGMLRDESREPLAHMYAITSSFGPLAGEIDAQQSIAHVC